MSVLISGAVVFFSLGCLIGILAIFWMWNGMRSSTWPSAIGRVVSSEIESRPCSDGPGYDHRLKLRYQFEFEGRTIQGSRLSFGDVLCKWSKSLATLEREATRYSLGATVTVYYHPERSERTTLETGIQEHVWMTLFVATFFLFVGVGIYLGWVSAE